MTRLFTDAASHLQVLFVAGRQGLGIHPSKQNFHFLFVVGMMVVLHYQIAPADIYIVLEMQYHTLRSKKLLPLPCPPISIALTLVFRPAGSGVTR